MYNLQEDRFFLQEMDRSLSKASEVPQATLSKFESHQICSLQIITFCENTHIPLHALLYKSIYDNKKHAYNICLGETIKAIRQDWILSQRMFSRIFKIPQATLSKLENKKTYGSPIIKIIEKVCNTYGFYAHALAFKVTYEIEKQKNIPIETIQMHLDALAKKLYKNGQPSIETIKVHLDNLAKKLYT